MAISLCTPYYPPLGMLQGVYTQDSKLNMDESGWIMILGSSHRRGTKYYRTMEMVMGYNLMAKEQDHADTQLQRDEILENNNKLESMCSFLLKSYERDSEIESSMHDDEPIILMVKED